MRFFSSSYTAAWIDHLLSNDNVATGHLTDGFNITCAAWQVCSLHPVFLLSINFFSQSHFRVPYMHGCPIPGDSVGQKLMHLFARKNDTKQSLSSISSGVFNTGAVNLKMV